MPDLSLAGLMATIARDTVNFISSLGYWGLFIGMAIESANVPLPSELILPFGGYLVSIGRLQFVQAAMAGTLGGIAGSIFSYFIGRWGGRPFLLKYGRYIGISRKHFDLAESWFLRYGEATVFFTRLMPVVRTFISLPAGISGMNFWRFVFFSFIGSLPWCFFLTFLGLKMGQNWDDLKYWFHRLDVVVIAAIVIMVIFYCCRKKRS